MRIGKFKVIGRFGHFKLFFLFAKQFSICKAILTHISGIVNTGTESRQLDFRLSPAKGLLPAASIYLTFAGRFDNMINVDFRCVRSGATE